MTRCLFLTLVFSATLAESLRADELPAQPQKLTYADWNYAKIVSDADGKPLLMRYSAQSQTVKEMRAVTKFVKETRVVDGQSVTLEIAKTEVVPVNASIWVWKASVAAMEDPRVQFIDVNGKGIDAETIRERLAKTTVVKWAEDHPDPYYLRSAKPDTVVVVAPFAAFADLPGAVKEQLPIKGTAPYDAHGKISTSTDGKRQIEILLLSAKSVKQGEKTDIVPKWTYGKLPCDFPGLALVDLQGKAVDFGSIRMDTWTPILLAGAGESPHPVMVSGVRPDRLILTYVGATLHNAMNDLDEASQPLPKPKIGRLPLPPLPPLPVNPKPPAPIDPKPRIPVNPLPTPVDPLPKNPVEGKEAHPAGAPPIAVVKKMLEVQWGPLGRFTKHEYNFKSIRFGPPLKEVVTVNGQGNFTGKVRYPTRVLCDINVIFTDGTSRMETKHQTFHFFQDPFGEWSFRFIENN